MRRTFAILVAAATAIGASAATFTPSQAAPMGPTATVLTSQGGTVEQIRDRHRGDDNWRHRHHRRHHRDNNFFPGFFFGFGNPYYAPRAYYGRNYQPYRNYGDCFRTWDGQVICR